MIDFLYANGCSWTAGNGIDDHHTLAHLPLHQRWEQMAQYAWPAVLANRLGVPYRNDSQGGGSNRRILRTTLDFLHRYPKEKYSSLLVVLGWTTVDRNELYIRENDEHQGWCMCNTSQPISTYKYPLVPDFSKGFMREVDEWHKQYLTTIFNYRACYTYFFQEMWLLSNLLENLGIRYIFFSSLPWKTFQLPAFDNIDVLAEFQTEIAALKKPAILNTRDCDDQYNVFSEFCRVNNVPMAHDHHTMIEGHEAWAEHLYSETKTVYGTI